MRQYAAISNLQPQKKVGKESQQGHKGEHFCSMMAPDAANPVLPKARRLQKIKFTRLSSTAPIVGIVSWL